MYAKARIDVTLLSKPTREAVKRNKIKFYQEEEEDIPIDMQHPKGMSVILTSYVDADHDSCQ